jgi:hypothetical protein
MLKKLMLLVIVLLLAIAGGGYYLFANLDTMIKRAIVSYGSAATQTAVNLSSLHLDLQSGKGELSGFSVGAPRGFTQPAMMLGKIEVQVNPSSIAGTGPIIIREVLIDTPAITYELNTDGGNNLQTIAANAKAYAAAVKQKISGASKAESTAKAGRKIIIKHLVIRSAKLGIVQPLLPNQHLTATLPDITLTNMGEASGGATAAEITNQLLAVIITKASAMTIQQMANPQELLKKLKGDALNKTLGNGLKGLLGN